MIVDILLHLLRVQPATRTTVPERLARPVCPVQSVELRTRQLPPTPAGYIAVSVGGSRLAPTRVSGRA